MWVRKRTEIVVTSLSTSAMWSVYIKPWWEQVVLGAPCNRLVHICQAICSPFSLYFHTSSIIQPANRMRSRMCASQTERGWSEGVSGKVGIHKWNMHFRLSVFDTISKYTEEAWLHHQKHQYVLTYSASVSLIGSYFRPRVCPIFRENILDNTLTIKRRMVSGLY